jgi:hypothetical protein
MKTAVCRTVVLVTLVLAMACNGRGPTTPSTSTTPPTPTFPPSAPRPPQGPVMSFEMTGLVTDDEGTPIAGATVTALLDHYTGPSVVTDASGRYSIRFASARGSNAGPLGTELAVAMAFIESPGYDWYERYILAPTEQFVENFRLHRIRRITAGEQAVVTVAPDDRVCGIDWSPGRETICGTIHIVARTDGILTVEAVPTGAGSTIHRLQVYDSRVGGTGNPVSIPVTAGTEYVADLALPWGFKASQSFVVTTSIAVREQ